MDENTEIERLISVVQKEWIVCGLGIGTLYGDFALEVAKRAVAVEREACARLASDHECGGEDDFICQHQNCGMCIAGAIRLRSK